MTRTERLWTSIAAALVSLALVGPAQAQQAEGTPEIGRKERQPLIGERNYKRLTAAHEALGEREYAKAIKALEGLEKSNLNPYEAAQVQQTFGYVYAQQEKYKQAIPYFEKALAMDSLPNQAHFGLMYSLAQLYATQERYQDSINLLVQWLKFQPNPNADAMILIGSNYAQMEQYRKGLPWVMKAIEEKGAEAKESWFQLGVAMNFEIKDYRAAENLLKTMITRWPENLKYWEMLAGAYQEMEKDKEALATSMVAYHKDLIDDEKKLLNLVRMNMFLEMPNEAGRLLDKEITAGRIEANEKNLELLLSAWTAAREFAKAADTIDRLAPLKEDGELYVQKAQLLMEQNDWSGTIEAGKQAIEKGGLKKPAGVYLIIAIAANEMDDFKTALWALDQTRQFDDDRVRRQAIDWRKFIEDRQAVTPQRTASR